MRLSAFTVSDDYPDRPTGTPRLAEVVDLARVAESSGLSTLWVAEHHFSAAGVCPSPPVLLSAAGAVTNRLRLGALVSVLPFHSPLELAEEYAMVDQLSGGRLAFGVGSGYIPLEFEGFGVDPDRKRELFDRHLETILSAWRGEEVRAGAPLAKPVRLNIRPRQSPHPPIRVAVQRKEALTHQGRLGRAVALIPYATVGSLEELAEEIAEYRRSLPNGASGDVAAAVHLYAGEAVDTARGALQRYLDSRRESQSTHYLARVREDPRQGRAEALEASGLALLGSARAVREGLERFARAGVDELLGIFDFGGLPAELTHRSVRGVAAAFGPGPLPGPG